MEGIAATQGLLRGQESVGYNFIRDGGSAEVNAGTVNIGRALTQPEMESIGGRLQEEFGDSIIPTNTADGVAFLGIGDDADYLRWGMQHKTKKLPDGIRRKDFKGREQYLAKVRSELKKTVKDISKSEFDTLPAFGANSGDLVGSYEAFKPSAYLPAIENSGVTDQLSTAAQQAAPLLEKLDAELVRAFPDIGARSQILMMTRQALASGGIAAVRKLVDQGLLPALVLGAIGSRAGNQQPSDRSPVVGGAL